MFTASYPAELHAEENGKGFWVSFADLGEALTGGTSVADALEQAADCLAEAIAGRIARGDEIPKPSRLRKGQHAIGVPLYLAPKFALYLLPAYLGDAGERDDADPAGADVGGQ